ncbi:MAG TPA: FemAB family XrtA/PEP-CTERM system-associated protein [Terriglobales bacterium]|nr:FemAB family XrtA/PEP-CTERM system-associated protein [Terriglobales bacterium]
MSIPLTCTPYAAANVCSYNSAMERGWDAFVSRHVQGTLFHLTAWKRAIERAFGFESRYLAVVDRGEIRGVLPLFLVRNLVQGKALISVPFGVYGGICADDDETSQLLREAACGLARQERVQYLELREQSPTPHPEFECKRLYVTFDRELPPDPDELLNSFPRDTRYMIRKAHKNGLHAVVDNAQLDLLYDIYAYSVWQLGSPVFPKHYFRMLMEEFGDRCEITTIWHQNRAVAGVMSFRFNDWVLPYYGGSLAEGRQLAANNLMYWEVMRRASERGIRYFDFGRSKLGTGAYAFKMQWNMRERPLPYQFYLVRRKTMPNFSPANPRFHLGVNLWKRIPLTVANTFGPSLVRLFP